MQGIAITACGGFNCADTTIHAAKTSSKRDSPILYVPDPERFVQSSVVHRRGEHGGIGATEVEHALPDRVQESLNSRQRFAEAKPERVALWERMMEKSFDLTDDSPIMTVAAAVALSDVSIGAGPRLPGERMQPLGKPGKSE
jgi:hypothetical protein